ncbi:MAG: hypothetical protein V1772_13815, partial [Chloroflexota bacterium]
MTVPTRLSRLARLAARGGALALLLGLVGLALTYAPQGAAQGALQADATWTRNAPAPEVWSKPPAALSVTALDADGLQPATSAYRYSADGGGSWSAWLSDASLQYSSPVTTTVRMTATVAALVDSATLNQIQFRIQDLSANVETSAPYTLRVDGTAPAAPQSLASTPASWTNVDSFSLTWANPADTAGITRAYYKLGGVPSGAGDYSGLRDGAAINTISGISLGARGCTAVYVWLQDAASNTDPTRRSSVTLCLDTEAPSGPLNLSASPATWTGTNAFDLTWANAPQSEAPISKAYYKFGSAPTHAADVSGFRTGVNIFRITGLAVPTRGAVPCFVWTEDAAGNANYATAVGVTLYYSGDLAPAAPFALQITPSGWTATNSFAATWGNPSTPSGIQAAWYKWDAPPSSPSDGTRVAGANIQTLTGLTVASHGEHMLYVWLEDGGGLKDHTKHSTAGAYYDAVAPVTTHSFTHALPPSGWFTDSVVVKLLPTDSWSGVATTRWRRVGGLWAGGTSFPATASQTF